MSDQEEQEDELLALSSIFDEGVFKTYKDGELNEGELLAFPDLPDQFTVKIIKTKKGSLVYSVSTSLFSLPIEYSNQHVNIILSMPGTSIFMHTATTQS